MTGDKSLKKRPTPPGPARIEYLRVQNYRALQDVELKAITPLTVLLGPNGSGKSTLFDVFNFLSECFQFGHDPLPLLPQRRPPQESGAP